MAKYRKKPVEVYATQWFKNGDHPKDYEKDINDPIAEKVWTAEHRKSENWEGDVVRYFRRPDVSGQHKCLKCGHIMDDHGWIDTLEGGHIVCPGDWIITGVLGEYYPCKPDIFSETYEEVK